MIYRKFILMKPISFKTHIDKLSYLKTFYLEIPTTVVKKVGGIGKVRLLCEVNKQITFQCGLMSLPEGKAYISINSKGMKELLKLFTVSTTDNKRLKRNFSLLFSSNCPDKEIMSFSPGRSYLFQFFSNLGINKQTFGNEKKKLAASRQPLAAIL